MIRRINLRDWEVRGLLAGRITALCRVVKPQPEHKQIHEWKGKTIIDQEHRMWCWKEHVFENLWDFMDNDDRQRLATYSPFGAPGDLLLGREAWQVYSYCPGEYGGIGELGYPVDPSCGPSSAVAVVYRADGEDGPWRSSTTMPDWAVRHRMTVKSVRCCRLQEVAEDDAKKLGASYHNGGTIGHSGWRPTPDFGMVGPTPVHAFAWQFQADNGRGAWEKNPWVWIAEVKR